MYPDVPKSADTHSGATPIGGRSIPYLLDIVDSRKTGDTRRRWRAKAGSEITGVDSQAEQVP